jgi:cytochrome c biogenesis protein CcmG/thiol:disulfide interchange protein DsbE
VSDEQLTQSDLPEWLEQVTGDDVPARVQQKLSPMAVALILVAVAVLAVIGYALHERNKGDLNSGPAPAFSVTIWNFDQLAMAGQPVSLSSLKGKTIVLNFWASWCIPCQQEAPMFERVWNDYKDQGVVFLGVDAKDPDKDVLAYIQEYGLTYPHALDQGGRMSKAYRTTGFPETFIIDGNGQIIEHFISSPSEADLRGRIEQAMSGA